MVTTMNLERLDSAIPSFEGLESILSLEESCSIKKIKLQVPCLIAKIKKSSIKQKNPGFSVERVLAEKQFGINIKKV